MKEVLLNEQFVVDDLVYEAHAIPVPEESLSEAAGALWLLAYAQYGEEGFYRAVEALTNAANPGDTK